jgi:hypothetical protein
MGMGGSESGSTPGRLEVYIDEFLDGQRAIGYSWTTCAERRSIVGGVVKSSGINCGTSSKASSVTKPPGVWLGLLVTADRGYLFTRFTGDCSGTEASYTLALTGPRTCGATFAGNK